MAIVLSEDGAARIIATAGEQADGAMSAGAEFDPENSLISDVVARGQTVYRPDMSQQEYVEEEQLVALGLRSRVAAPLLAGARPIGLIALSRREPDAFRKHEIELAGLLGRLAASAVQNIRAYESERRTVEELRRLSTLRADFVSLVSHELRSPMAAVIGAARTLQDRWRMLSAVQRESFLALIGDETARLAALVADVLDTSRIEAGMFSYRFEEVDLGRVVGEAVETAELAQQEVPVIASVHGRLPTIRGDRARLRQVLGNLIENAVKYSPEGGEVRVSATPGNGAVRIVVKDGGPGIPRDQQTRIFEKFGRVDVPGASKPGTGLGLFIARSIAEAHGGSLDVSSGIDPGATFTLILPVDGR
jgi:signal transduction histidine kinase